MPLSKACEPGKHSFEIIRRDDVSFVTYCHSCGSLAKILWADISVATIGDPEKQEKSDAA